MAGADQMWGDDRFSDLFAAMAVAMIVTDLDGRVVALNDAACELLGRQADDLVGEFVTSSVHPEEQTAAADIRARFLAGERRPLHYLRRYLRPDGSEVWADLHTRLIFDDDGSPSCFCAILLDVTERRRVEESEAHLAAIVQSSPDAIVSSDLDGKVTSWNSGAEHLFGYTAEEMIGADSMLLWPDQDPEAWRSGLERIAANQNVQVLETVRVRKDGTSVKVSIIGCGVRDRAGTLVGVAAILRDLSDRDRAEARFRAVLDASPDAVIAADDTLRIVLANRAAHELFGTRRRLVGEELGALLSEPDAPGSVGWALAPRSVPIGTLGSSAPEVVGRRDDGTAFPAEVTLSTIEADEGQLLLVGIRDGTERRQAAIVASSSDAILTVTLDGVITSWNAGAEHLFGHSADLAIGRSLSLVVPPGLMDDLHTVLQRIAAGEHLAPFETQRVHRSGRLLTVSLSVSPVRDRSGTIIGASAAARDITEAKAAQEALRESHAINTAILESSLDCIITMDADGRIVEFNPTAESVFGYSVEEARGRAVAELLVPPDLRPAHVDGLAHYLETGEGPILGRRIEARAMRRDGSELPVEVAVNRVDVEGEPRFTAFVRDLTEAHRLDAAHKELEHRLQQAQRLEGLGQLAGGIAHDFNNLLSVIMSYAAFIADGTDDDTVRDDVGEILAASERAAAMTKQLLIFSQRDPVRPTVIAVDEVIANMEALLRRSIGEHIEIRIEAEPDLPAVLADAGQVEQVVLNLVVNARDAMPEGGTLRIRTHRRDLDGAYCATHPGVDPGAFVEVSVSDTGTGMTPEVASRVFEPFFTTKEPGRGTGLGLATAYGIVSEAGGFIEVYSEPGLGTEFRVRLPVTDGQAASGAAEARPPLQPGNGAVVLLVEDEPALMRSTARMLERHGYEVLQAPLGREAIALAASARIDVLLTDMVMPEMSGRRVAEAVSEHQPHAAIVYMSGFSQGTAGSPIGRTDDLDLIQKPFTERTLLERVHAALTRSHDR